jgi:hypothetical protein
MFCSERTKRGTAKSIALLKPRIQTSATRVHRQGAAEAIKHAAHHKRIELIDRTQSNADEEALQSSD